MFSLRDVEKQSHWLCCAFGQTCLKKTIDFYISSTSDDSLSDVFITGGAAQTPGLAKGISDALDREVNLFNPFDKIAFDKKKFSEDDLTEIGYRGVVAMGLGMRGSE